MYKKFHILIDINISLVSCRKALTHTFFEINFFLAIPIHLTQTIFTKINCYSSKALTYSKKKKLVYVCLFKVLSRQIMSLQRLILKLCNKQ